MEKQSTKQYSNDIYTFDTEATTVFLHNGRWQTYSDDIDVDNDDCLAFCYASMVCDAQGPKLFTHLNDAYDWFFDLSQKKKMTSMLSGCTT